MTLRTRREAVDDLPVGQLRGVGLDPLKALLLFAVAVIGLRLSQRRMLAELNVFDLVVTVAVGAIIGRTATSTSTSFATGAIALITLLVAHRMVAALHRQGWFAGLLDRRPLVLLARGRLQTSALRTAGLTERDVYRLLRQEGATDLDALQYVLYEDGGQLSIIRVDQPRSAAIRVGLHDAGIDDDDIDFRD
jgi:uncharacterized membrane protein YcaP (DUF421 family)